MGICSLSLNKYAKNFIVSLRGEKNENETEKKTKKDRNRRK